MAVAEVASTFFEQAVIEKLESVLPKDEQIILLHNKILGDINTVFRQIACFNFETELHRAIRNTGQLSHEEIATLLQKHMQSYMGDTVTVTELDGYQFVSWSHIRRFFYVYSYAYGQLISRSLYTKWKENPTYSQKIKQFLASGSSKSPEDIFKSIGIKTDENFFLAGIKSIEEDIKRLEKMVKKTK
jgi:oligoendopeptidase F